MRARSWKRSKCSFGRGSVVDLLPHRGELAHRSRYLARPPMVTRARQTDLRLVPRRTHRIAAGPTSARARRARSRRAGARGAGSPRRRAAGRAVREVELDLHDAEARADGVDRHPDLHAVAARERQHVPERLAAERPLARDRRAQLRPSAPRIAQRAKPSARPKPPPDASRERGDREVAPRRARPPRPAGRARAPSRAEVAVAEHEIGGSGAGPRAQRPLARPRHRPALADVRSARTTLGPRRRAIRGGRVARAVVGDHHARAGNAPRERARASPRAGRPRCGRRR